MNDLLFDNKHVDALIFSFAICYGFLRLLTGLKTVYKPILKLAIQFIFHDNIARHI